MNFFKFFASIAPSRSKQPRAFVKKARGCSFDAAIIW